MSRSTTTVALDGRTLEGGGQLLRVALSLSSLTGTPVHVTHIRGKRGVIKNGVGSAGGLKAAHLAAVTWLASATAATTTGMELKSTEILFEPTKRVCDGGMLDNEELWRSVYEDGRLVRRETIIPMSTNGSTLLILQAIFPVLIFLPSEVPLRVTIHGGTNGTSSPSIEYISQIFLPSISAKLNLAPIKVTVHSRGWDFGGNQVGKVSFDIEPLRLGTVLPALKPKDRGKVEKIYISVIAPSNGSRDQIKDEVARQLTEALPDVELLWVIDEDSGSNQRNYLLLVAETSSGFRLGKDLLSSMKSTKKTVKDVNEGYRKMVSRVIKNLQEELAWEGCVDEHLEDQLVIFEALAQGRSEVNSGKGREASLHTQTAQWVATRILGVSFEEGGCNGIGFSVDESHDQFSKRLAALNL